MIPQGRPILVVTDRRFWRRSIGSEQRVASLVEHLAARFGNVVVAYVGRIARDERRPLERYASAHPGLAIRARPGVLLDLRLWRDRWLGGERSGPACDSAWTPAPAPAPGFGRGTSNPLLAARAPARRAFVQQLVRDLRPRAVIVSFARLTPTVYPRPPGAHDDVRYLIDTHDVLHQRAARFRASGAREFVEIDAAQEAEALATYDAILAIHEGDRRNFAALVPERPVLCVPHGLPLPSEASAPCAPPESDAGAPSAAPLRLGFLGGRDESNAAGLAWFLEQVFPALLARHPRAFVLHVAGAVCDRLPLGHGGFDPSSLHPLGLVASIEAFWPNIDVAINPIRFGSGLKIKNVEALGFGRPLVTTPIGAEGLEVAAPDGLVIADSPEAWLEALSALLADPARRSELGRRGRLFAEQCFTPTAAFTELDHLLDTLPGARRRADGPILVLSSRRAFESLVGAIPADREARFCFAKPGRAEHTARVDSRVVGARLVISQSYSRPELNRSILAARRQGIPTLLLIDGPLEWSNVHSNPSLRRPGNEAVRGLYRPVVHDAIAAIGPAQAETIVGWNAGREPVAFCYANRRIWTELPAAPAPDHDFLLTTARTAAFDARERERLAEALATCAGALERAGHSTLVRVFDAALRRHVRRHAPSATFETEGRFTSALARARCVIGTPSSVLLEAMCHDRPTAILDFRGQPLFYSAGWRIATDSSPESTPPPPDALPDALPESIFAAMLAAAPEPMAQQRRAVAEQLSSIDFFEALDQTLDSRRLDAPRPFDALDLEFERNVVGLGRGWRARLLAPIYRLVR